MKLQYRAAAILFLEGLASSGLQMITIRQTIPFVGSSVLSTSIIISTFLAALALGYYIGGRVRSEDYERALYRNILIGCTIFGVGLSYPFVETFFFLLSNLLGTGAILGNPLLHLCLFCLLVMAPLVFALAQTVPLLLNTTVGLSNSRAAGNATAISTVGNVIGCVLTSLVVMYFLGVGASIILNCLYLIICAWLTTGQTSKSKATTFVATSAIIAVSVGLNVLIPRAIMFSDGAYSNIEVFDVPGGKKMVMNGSNSSFIGTEERDGWPYIEVIKEVVFASQEEGLDVLVLGAGGFTLTTGDIGSAKVTYVDVDPEAKRAAEEAFLGTPITGQFIQDDARRYLLRSTERWDFIVVDVYSNSSTIPAHISTLEFFNLVSSRLKPAGKAIMNIVAKPTLEDSYSASMDRTIREAFPYCITHISGFRNALENILYFCRNKNASSEVAGLYKDDTTRVEVEGFMALHRGNSK
ncbi:fused MFS/spermidine synthase [Zhongshania marina]|uniref:Spermidine synthase n=1 Tax=Zhongshania marina TaxID=2304603 RepID=A0A2S4HBY5_9GAMM|nr:fused MFS/spermidine synthase [Marortus luteolus]POP51512.1 spermidine synthase [Marortus luteolus]